MERPSLLYVAPESLTKEDNVEFLKTVKISSMQWMRLIVFLSGDMISVQSIDESVRLSTRLVMRLVIALTATATDKVRTDIKKNLGIVDAKEFKSSFNRANLYYEVRPKTEGY